ncbi:ABC transporter substrate-binding protein [Sporichthya polymorpha]|uniref:ABC transporter substrate-binding protein n=1 Tax=Sporichthya polymorpha TaxID=35751 RepID=UPI00037AEF91|nr:ABC transporter substrate-binding protein [Sporichthya polymorpha]
MALVAGCGGSDITEAQAPGVAAGGDTGTSADTGAIDSGTTGTTGAATGDTGAAAPGAQTGTDPAAAANAGTAANAGAAAGGTTGGAAAPGTKGGKAGNAAGGGKAGGAAAAGGSAVERTVASHAIFGGNAPCKPATLSEVAIGNVSTLSGVLGELFSPVRPALETWVASQNACGGLNGHKIRLYIEDDQGDPSTASSKVQAMIQSKKVLAFVGNIQVLTVDAVKPVIERSGIPIIGADITNATWFGSDKLFPQGPPGFGVAFGYLDGAVNYFKKKNVGNIWCIEVPRACEQINRAMKELAPEFGATFKKDIQVSITSPSYVQQCLDFKAAGVEVLAMTFDAASMNRLARSCSQAQYFPKVLPYPLGVGNEKQFLQGNKWLGDAYVTMNHFPWFGNSTPAEKYWQASIKKFNPGFTSGGAASLGWTAGALLVAAAAELPAENPTTADLLKVLYQFKGQKFTELGGLTGPLTFNEGGTPKVPYCLFAGIANADNTGWAKAISKPKCTNKFAPSDPQGK